MMDWVLGKAIEHKIADVTLHYLNEHRKDADLQGISHTRTLYIIIIRIQIYYTHTMTYIVSVTYTYSAALLLVILQP